MKTFSQKPTNVTRSWYVIDASQAPLGRIATVAASLLIGKGKVTLTPHTDGGDFVIVINASKIQVTGNKLEGKIYYRHTLYPGGIKQAQLRHKLEKDPNSVIVSAIRGMLPVNKLRDGRLKRLKVYSGGEHQHEAQKPETYNISKLKGNK